MKILSRYVKKISEQAEQGLNAPEDLWANLKDLSKFIYTLSVVYILSQSVVPVYYLFKYFRKNRLLCSQFNLDEIELNLSYNAKKWSTLDFQYYHTGRLFTYSRQKIRFEKYAKDKYIVVADWPTEERYREMLGWCMGRTIYLHEFAFIAAPVSVNYNWASREIIPKEVWFQDVDVAIEFKLLFGEQ